MLLSRSTAGILLQVKETSSPFALCCDSDFAYYCYFFSVVRVSFETSTYNVLGKNTVISRCTLGNRKPSTLLIFSQLPSRHGFPR